MLDSNFKVNFETANILLLERSQHCVDVLSQMFQGFGARNCIKCTTIEEAKAAVLGQTLDIIVVDPQLKDGDGHDFIRWLRRSGLEPNRASPVLVASANGTLAAIRQARDAGGSFFIVKPLSPSMLMERIMRVMRDTRLFILHEAYTGPDRRFKHEGPPPDIGPRRSADLNTQLGEATSPNMSQDQIDAFLKPQRVTL